MPDTVIVMTDAWLTIEKSRPGIAVVTLNRPDSLNAVTLALQRQLDARLRELEEDGDTRCIVLTGAGERAFCAGYDLHEMADWDEDQTLLALVEREALVWRWATSTIPVVAALNGIALGFGAILATLVDVRIGCPDTVIKFTAGEHGGANATWSLPDLVGRGRATEILMSARPVDAVEAERMGLLNRVVARADLLPEALRVSDAIAAKPPAGVRAIKRLVRQHAGRPVEDRFAAENTAMRTELRPGRIRDLYLSFLDQSSRQS